MWLYMFAKTQLAVKLKWCILLYVNYTPIKIIYGIYDTRLYDR